MRQIMPHIYAILLLLIIVAVSQKHCLADNTIIFGGVSHIPPLSYEEDGVVKGFFPDVFHEIAHRARFQTRIKLYPFKRLNVYLQNGTLAGAISIYHKKEREKYLIYSTAPVLISRTLIFVKKDKKFPFHSISDLFGKRIGTMAGWTVKNKEYNQAKKEKKFLIDGVYSYEQNLKKLILNRVDCLVMSEQLTWYHANILGMAESIVPLDKPIDSSVTYIAVSKVTKNIPDIQNFIKKLNITLNNIIADGTYEKIQIKHGIKTIN